MTVDPPSAPRPHAERKQLGAWATPPALVDFLVGEVLAPAVAAREDLDGFRILDPACGDGRILAAAVRHLSPRFGEEAARRAVHGVELHSPTAEVARRALRVGPDQLATGDGRELTAARAERFDVVLGNPPFLNQLATATTRAGRSALGGGPYADTAAEFLALALRLARADGGRIGLVLPVSVLSTRDAAPIRQQVLSSGSLEGLWWVGEQVFDASVRTFVATMRRGWPSGPVRRWIGVPAQVAPATAPPASTDPTWGPLVADLIGIPQVRLPAGPGRIGDVALALAGFRQHFYGLVPYVDDRDRGPRLVTAGLIDPGRCAWGSRPARFAGQTYSRPRVDLTALAAADPRLAAWVRARQVPKVVVASQTRVIEAAVDEAGGWVPSVPVVALVPLDTPAGGGGRRGPVDVWCLGAALCAPPLAAWAAARGVGAAMTPGGIKLRADELADLPLPTGPLATAAERLRAGDVDGCAAAAMAAYGVDDAGLLAWWRSRAVRRARRARAA